MPFAFRVALERLPGWGTFSLTSDPQSHRFHALIPAFHQPSPNPPQYDDRRSNDAPRCRRRRRLGHGRRTTPNLESPVCDEQRPRLDLCHSMAYDQQIILDYESLRSWSGRVTGDFSRQRYVRRIVARRMAEGSVLATPVIRPSVRIYPQPAPQRQPRGQMDSGTIIVMASPSREDTADEVMTGNNPPGHLEEPSPTYTHKRKRTGQNEAPANGPLRNRRKVDDAREASTTEEAALRTMAQAHRPASDTLTPILSDMDRRHNTRRSVLAKIAHALDTIIEDCREEDKELAAEITKGFTAFLQAKTGDSISPHSNEHLQENGPAPRIPEEHRGWAHSQHNFALRQAVCKTLNLSLVDIPDVYHTATGVAVRPRDKEAREKLLRGKEELARSLRADAVEVPITWVNYVVPGCPTRLSNIFGETFETDTLLRDEVIAQTGVEPDAKDTTRAESAREQIGAKTVAPGSQRAMTTRNRARTAHGVRTAMGRPQLVTTTAQQSRS
ncbi:uncharacterized protein PG986_014446 [Apiospora aurea]|uniref:Uncharacterized protein n=1 Tax=Apiospora aurea TaxID=335848 RepID=A0ABR1PT13_9PEZI